MNVLPELRDQLTRAVAAPRRARQLPVRMVALTAVAAAAVALLVSVLTTAEVEREVPPAGSPPVSQKSVGCERGYVLHRESVGKDDWRSRAVEVGPLTFVGLAELADEPDWRFAPAAEMARHLRRDDAEQVLENGRDRYAAVGLNVLVEPDSTATLTIEPSARGSVGLLTDLPTFGGYRAFDGVARITFRGCPPVPPEARRVPDIDAVAFGVAFIVEGARCVPVTVAREGEAPQRAVLSFGAGRC